MVGSKCSTAIVPATLIVIIATAAVVMMIANNSLVIATNINANVIELEAIGIARLKAIATTGSKMGLTE